MNTITIKMRAVGDADFKLFEIEQRDYEAINKEIQDGINAAREQAAREAKMAKLKGKPNELGECERCGAIGYKRVMRRHQQSRKCQRHTQL